MKQIFLVSTLKSSSFVVFYDRKVSKIGLVEVIKPLRFQHTAKAATLTMRWTKRIKRQSLYFGQGFNDLEKLTAFLSYRRPY